MKIQASPSGTDLRGLLNKCSMFVNGCGVKTKLCLSDTDRVQVLSRLLQEYRCLGMFGTRFMIMMIKMSSMIRTIRMIRMII